MAAIQESSNNPTPETFPDWLSQIAGEYKHLTELYERERSYAARLAELMSLVQHEVGVPIPLNPSVLSAAFPGATEAQLAPGATITFVDSGGNRQSKPLSLMPLETIIFTVHESVFRMRQVVLEERKAMVRRVRALERVVVEMEKATESYRLRSPEAGSQQEVASGSPAPSPGAGVQLDSEDGAEDEGSFEFKGMFREKRHAVANQPWNS